MNEVTDILDQIDTILARGGEPSRLLWDILAALRGPDEAGRALQKIQTIRIREAAFPKTAAAEASGTLRDNSAFFSVDAFCFCFVDAFCCFTSSFPRDEKVDGSSHYGGHVLDATQALAAIGRLTVLTEGP